MNYSNKWSTQIVKSLTSQTVRIMHSDFDVDGPEGLTIDNSLASCLRLILTRMQGANVKLYFQFSDKLSEFEDVLGPSSKYGAIVVNLATGPDSLNDFIKEANMLHYKGEAQLCSFFKSKGIQNPYVCSNKSTVHFFFQQFTEKELWALISTIPVWLKKNPYGYPCGFKGEEKLLEFFGMFDKGQIAEAYEFLNTTSFYDDFIEKKLYGKLKSIRQLNITKEIEHFAGIERQSKEQLQVYERKILEAKSNLSNAKFTLLGLNLAMDNLEKEVDKLKTELNNILAKNPTLSVLELTSDTMTFTYTTTYRNWDQKLIEAMIDNPKSICYQDIPITAAFSIIGENDHETAKEVLKAIFVDQVLKIRTACGFYFRMSSTNPAVKRLDADITTSVIGDSAMKNMILNPNIMSYDCFGSYSLPIRTALQDSDIIRAIAVAMTAAASITVDEGPTAGQIYRAIWDNRPVMENLEGDVLNLEQAIEYLKREGYYVP